MAQSLKGILEHPLVKILGFLLWSILLLYATETVSEIRGALKDSREDRAAIHAELATHKLAQASTESELTTEVKNLSKAVESLNTRLDKTYEGAGRSR